jgi:hypothetical protein
MLNSTSGNRNDFFAYFCKLEVIKISPTGELATIIPIKTNFYAELFF